MEDIVLRICVEGSFELVYKQLDALALSMALANKKYRDILSYFSRKTHNLYKIIILEEDSRQLPGVFWHIIKDIKIVQDYVDNNRNL